jgi:glycogen debranching enzyme
MYEDGTLAEPPLALCEVQGYLYQAKKHMAELALIMKDIKLCEQLLNECTQLKNAFNTDFWMEDKGFYAMGLDQDRKPLRVISSNPGHCLETDLVIDEYANRVAHRLMREDMYGGWGIRTLATTTMGYNPMSYHNGSVWPHDNAMIARGFRSMHLPQYTQDVFSGLFEACRRMHYKRMPELFCGFPREISKSDPPIRYPVACSPQAWAASAPFSLIKSLLNIKPQSDSRCLVIDQPILPPGINHVGIKNLRVENTRFDLEFSRINNSMSVQIVDQRGDLEVTIRNLNTPY